MTSNAMTYYPIKSQSFYNRKFEEAFHDTMLVYSLLDLAILGDLSEENFQKALQQSIETCYLAGINSNYHFKQVYVFDNTIGTLRIDWRLSKTGLNLIIIQTPLLNNKMAIWQLKLAENNM